MLNSVATQVAFRDRLKLNSVAMLNGETKPSCLNKGDEIVMKLNVG